MGEKQAVETFFKKAVATPKLGKNQALQASDSRPTLG
jgi:hypothetical protein